MNKPNTMKKILIFLMLTIGLSSVYAQKFKVLDKSGRKPDWVNAVVKGYVIVVGSGSDIETSKQKSLLSLKEQIITSVAENIKTSSDYSRSEKTVNDITTYIQNFETNTQTQSADMSFLKGISLSNVEEYYWEKVKEDNNIKFYYHLKYPFDEFQLKKLVEEFEKADRQLTEELEALLEKIPNVNSVEEINETLDALQKLSKSFLDQRKNKAELGISQLNGMLKSIMLVQIENNPGELRYVLRIGEKVITTAVIPKVTSKCAVISEILNNKSEWVVKYSYQGCYDDPSNALTVIYNFGGTIIKNNFAIDINANKADIILKEDLNISSLSDDGTNITSAKCQMTLFSKYSSVVVIEKVILNWDNCPPVIIENVNAEIKGKGNHEITLQINQPLDKKKYSSTTQAMVNGTILYRSVTGEKLTYKIYSQNVTTNW
jgi:hypothetical protein